MKIVGYFKEKGTKSEAQEVFVVIDDKWESVTKYCPVGHHSEMDRSYLDKCEEITKEEYIKAGGNLDTPSEYL